MSKIDSILIKTANSQSNVNFDDLCKVCEHYFGKPHQDGTSHKIYKTPWPGDPRINIQSKKGRAKPYQVKQVLKALEKLEEQEKENGSEH